METIALGLAAKVVEILSPYVKKGFDKFSEDVGKAGAEKVKGLLDTIKARFSGDKVASKNLAEYEKKPEIYQPVIQETLKEKMLKDKDMAAELEGLVKELGPTLELIQKIKILEGEATVLESDEMKSGKLKATQEIDEVREKGKATTVKIKKIG